MKIVRTLLALLITFGLFSVSPVFAAEKSSDQYYMDDVYYDHEAYEELERFFYTDILSGYEETEIYEEDGEEYEYTSILIKPDNPITRAEFTKIIVNAMNLTSGEIVKTFPDVKPSNWYYDYVQIATSRGIIIGNPDGSFKPNDKITRAQMASMIYRAFSSTVDFSAAGSTFKDVTINNFAYEAISKAASVGIIKGYKNEFKPNEFAKRSHAILMIDRALHLEPGTTEDETAILQTVHRNITEEFQFTEQLDLEALQSLYHETTVGYYLAFSLDSITVIDAPELEGSMSIKKIGEHTSTITSLNKQFAEVRVDDLKVNLSMIEPKMSFDITVDMAGTAYLKKTEDGIWKIYNIVYDEDESYEDLLLDAMEE